MIDITIPGTKVTKYYPVAPNSQVHTALTTTEPTGSIFEEAVRREKIVQELYAKCGYNVGDKVVVKHPTAKDDATEEFIVLAIADSYTKLNKDEPWPESDNPMIVHLQSCKDNSSYWCTTNFAVKRS